MKYPTSTLTSPSLIHESREKTSKVAAERFLNILVGAHKKARTVARADEVFHLKKGLKRSEKEIEQYEDDFAVQQASSDISRTFSNDGPYSSQLKEVADFLGEPNSVVKLPRGDFVTTDQLSGINNLVTTTTNYKVMVQVKKKNYFQV